MRGGRSDQFRDRHRRPHQWQDGYTRLLRSGGRVIWTRAYTPVAHALLDVKALKDELGLAAGAMNVNAQYIGGRADTRFAAAKGPVYNANEECYGKFVAVSVPHVTNDMVESTGAAAGGNDAAFTRIQIPTLSQAITNPFGVAKAYLFLMGLNRSGGAATMTVLNRAAP